MTIAVQNRARSNRAQAAAVIGGTARAGLSGKSLARHVARKQSAITITDWPSYYAAAAALNDGMDQLPKLERVWRTLDLIVARADMQCHDLTERIRTLEEKLAGEREPAARAQEPKPQRALSLQLMQDVSAKSVTPLIKALEANPGRPVKLTIASHGGRASEGQRLARAIEKHGNVSACAVVNCDSIATVIWAAARARSCLRGTGFLVHAPHLSDGSKPTPADQRRLDGVAHDIAAYLAKRSDGRTKAATFRSMMTQEGVKLDGVQMCALGLLNTVIKRPHTPKGRKS